MPVSSKGTTISYATGGSPATRLIGYLTNLPEVMKSMEHLDSKDLDSTGPNYTPSGITDIEPMPVEGFYVPNDTAQEAMEAKIGSTSTTTFTITLPGSPAGVYTVVGYVKSFSRGPFTVGEVIPWKMEILPTSASYA